MGKLKAGIVICSRLSSSRVPGKPLVTYNGKAQIELLIAQVTELNIPIYVAVPENEVFQYSFLVDKFPRHVRLFTGYEDDPLKRMYECAKENGLDSIVRLTHDKIFIDVEMLEAMLDVCENIDYVYSSDFIPGSGCEVIGFHALEKASNKFNRVEHISYAIKAITNSIYNLRFEEPNKDLRLLIDYPQDVQLMSVIFSALGTDTHLTKVVKFLKNNTYLKKMNKLPKVTVYTCAKNAGKWIKEAMNSVAIQKKFVDYEYILIDDYSTDNTLLLMSEFCAKHPNARFIRNPINKGLASSSNIALKQARGNYIIRMDADDFFVGNTAVDNMVKEIEKTGVDAIYPNCFSGLSKKKIQKGKVNHHVGGCLFKTAAINHVKFTDHLMNYDGLDLFLRAKDRINIGYYDKPAFCYRQHNESMSKSNLRDRKKTRKIIESKYV